MFFNLNCLGETAKKIVKSCIKKRQKGFKQEVNSKFATQYKITKMSIFANTKDKTPSLIQSSIVFKFKCPGCTCNYNCNCSNKFLLEQIAI